MGKPGRPRKLDDAKKQQIVTSLRLGATREMAAEHAGCSLVTLISAERRDREFADRTRRAQMDYQMTQLHIIDLAGRNSWQAAAWLLERLNPAGFARRKSETLAAEDLRAAVPFVTELAFQELPPEARERFWNRMQRHLTTFIERRTNPQRSPRAAQRRRQADKLFEEQKLPADVGHSTEGGPAAVAEAIASKKEQIPEEIDRKTDPNAHLMDEIQGTFLRSSGSETPLGKELASTGG